jgi:hypothetical protein
LARKTKERTEGVFDTSGIERRLDVIIHVLLKQTEIQEMSSRGQIALLSQIGLKDTDIAGILGKTRGYVASELSILRRGSHGKGE